MSGGESECVLRPIGVFHADAVYTYDVPRQGVLAGENRGVVTLTAGCGYEQALEGLEGFSHIWLLFWFDRNDGWRPKIQPPRHVDHKVGVFASRSPYRPNPVGMSAVRLLRVRGRELEIAGHDLLDGTPILDIKPYLAYADAFPEASPGWTGEGDQKIYNVILTEEAERQLRWLEERGVTPLRGFVQDQLASEPLNSHHHRLLTGFDGPVLAYRTWRARFDVTGNAVVVSRLFGGYTAEQLAETEDRYGDKPLHREFLKIWN